MSRPFSYTQTILEGFIFQTECTRVRKHVTWKKFRSVRDLNPWPLRCRYSALPTELTSQLGAGLKSTTSLVVFLAARISYIRFFAAVHIYEFHISKIIIHDLNGLFGPNVLTSSQLASYLSWQSAAPVSQRSWVQIPYEPEFFSGLNSTTSSVVFLAAGIS